MKRHHVPQPDHHPESGPAHTVSADLMLGRLEGVGDWPTAHAGERAVHVRIAALMLAGVATALSLPGGPGVMAPRIGEAPAVVRMPAHPKLKR